MESPPSSSNRVASRIDAAGTPRRARPRVRGGARIAPPFSFRFPPRRRRLRPKSRRLLRSRTRRVPADRPARRGPSGRASPCASSGAGPRTRTARERARREAPRRRANEARRGGARFFSFPVFVLRASSRVFGVGGTLPPDVQRHPLAERSLDRTGGAVGILRGVRMRIRMIHLRRSFVFFVATRASATSRRRASATTAADSATSLGAAPHRRVDVARLDAPPVDLHLRVEAPDERRGHEPVRVRDAPRDVARAEPPNEARRRRRRRVRLNLLEEKTLRRVLGSGRVPQAHLVAAEPHLDEVRRPGRGVGRRDGRAEPSHEPFIARAARGRTATFHERRVLALARIAAAASRAARPARTDRGRGRRRTSHAPPMAAPSARRAATLATREKVWYPQHSVTPYVFASVTVVDAPPFPPFPPSPPSHAAASVGSSASPPAATTRSADAGFAFRSAPSTRSRSVASAARPSRVRGSFGAPSASRTRASRGRAGGTRRARRARAARRARRSAPARGRRTRRRLGSNACGDATKTTSPARMPCVRTFAAQCAANAPRWTRHPFGAPVLPEVKKTDASAAGRSIDAIAESERDAEEGDEAEAEANEAEAEANEAEAEANASAPSSSSASDLFRRGGRRRAKRSPPPAPFPPAPPPRARSPPEALGRLCVRRVRAHVRDERDDAGARGRGESVDRVRGDERGVRRAGGGRGVAPANAALRLDERADDPRPRRVRLKRRAERRGRRVGGGGGRVRRRVGASARRRSRAPLGPGRRRGVSRRRARRSVRAGGRTTPRAASPGGSEPTHAHARPSVGSRASAISASTDGAGASFGAGASSGSGASFGSGASSGHATVPGDGGAASSTTCRRARRYSASAAASSHRRRARGALLAGAPLNAAARRPPARHVVLLERVESPRADRSPGELALGLAQGLGVAAARRAHPDELLRLRGAHARGRGSPPPRTRARTRGPAGRCNTGSSDGGARRRRGDETGPTRRA